ncbi:MAG: SMP-30/gluconolactonase/LRE family protein [Verrucomicrobiia bacterium]
MNSKRANVLTAIFLTAGILISGPVISGGAEKKSAENKTAKQPMLFPRFGKVEKNSQPFDKIISADAVVEKVAEGFVSARCCAYANDSVLISDIGSNIIYSWNEKNGLKIYQRLRVYSTNLAGLYGPAGIAKDRAGKILVCHHGDRRIVRIENQHRLLSMADYFNWMRFNGPYGIAVKSNGDIYFSDPPFDAIEKGIATPQKEMTFNGIYRITKSGYVDLLSTKLECPLGIAFSPDENFLYVVNQTDAGAVVMRIPVKKDGTLEKPQPFHDLSYLFTQKKEQTGGITVDKNGNLYIATPSGILVVDGQGKQLGSILTEQPATSCAFAENGKYLYITTKNALCRVKTVH